ncbi:MAG: hypothetical protein ABSE51_15595 [Terracidiphilus sp.]|jgi:hypothetical protein
MEITARGLWTLIHGMGFGGLYLLACSGVIVELRRRRTIIPDPQGADHERFLQIYLLLMAALAWLAVLTGTYLIYPWYRAVPPSGTTNLVAFPQRFLMASASTAGWHSIGMEWKEHLAWLVPIATTTAAAVSLQYGRHLRSHLQLRKTVLAFLAVSFFAAGVAGFFGAMLNKNAPVEGGKNIQILEEK